MGLTLPFGDIPKWDAQCIGVFGVFPNFHELPKG